MCVCDGVAGAHNSFAAGPNKNCTVEPCGLADSFYRARRVTYVRLRACLHQSGGGKHDLSFQVSNCLSPRVVELSFICFLKDIIVSPHVKAQSLI